MSDFVKVLTYLDLQKSRKATLDDVAVNPQKNNKYFSIVGPSRAIKKIPYVITLPAHYIAYPYATIPQLIFQYNVTMRVPFGIKNLRVGLTQLVIDKDTTCESGGLLTIKWRNGNTVSRYVLDGSLGAPSLYPLTQLNFPYYSGQQIPVNFCVEFWMTVPIGNPPYVGIFNDLKLVTTNLINPVSSDQIEIAFQGNAAIPLEQLGYAMPEVVPTNYTTQAWLDN